MENLIIKGNEIKEPGILGKTVYIIKDREIREPGLFGRTAYIIDGKEIKEPGFGGKTVFIIDGDKIKKYYKKTSFLSELISGAYQGYKEAKVPNKTPIDKETYPHSENNNSTQIIEENQQTLSQQFQCGKYSQLEDKRCATCEHFDSQRKITEIAQQTCVETTFGFCKTTNKDKGALSPNIACENWKQWSEINKEKERIKIALEYKLQEEKQEEIKLAEKLKAQKILEEKIKREQSILHSINKKYFAILGCIIIAFIFTFLIFIDQFLSIFYFIALNNIQYNIAFTNGLTQAIIKTIICLVFLFVETLLFIKFNRKRKKEIDNIK